MAVALMVSPLLGATVIYPLVGETADCAFVIAYLVAAVVGGPVSVWLAGRRSPWWHYTLAGAAVGALPFALLDAYWLSDILSRPNYPFVAHDIKRALPLLAGGTMCGAVTATLMWAIAFRQEE